MIHESLLLHREKSVRGPFWLLTLADLLSLLITFFILKYAISTRNLTEWQSVIESEKQQLLELKAYQPDHSKFIEESKNDGHSFEYLHAILAAKLAVYPELQKLKLIYRPEAIALLLPFCFEKENAVKLTMSGKQLITLIGDLVNQLGKDIDIVGILHSQQKIHDALEWELAMNRAMVVTHELKRSGYAHTIYTYGISEKALLQWGNLALSQQDDVSYATAIILHHRPAMEE